MNGRAREGFYVLWTAAIIICLAVCVGVLLYVSAVGGRPKESVADVGQQQVQDAGDQSSVFTTAEPLPADQGALDAQQQAGEQQQAGGEQQPDQSVPSPTILGETEDMGQEYIDRISFLGDSTTYGLAAYGVLPYTQIWVPSNGTLSLFNCPIALINYYPKDDPDNPRELSIADTAAAAQPEYLVITLGINGVALLDEEQFKGYYRDVITSIQQASPNTKIMCQSIYPVIDAQAPTGINNAGINAANQWILQIAEEMGLRYLNTCEALMDSTGSLSTEFIDPGSDGIHMHSAGYNAILQYIRTHGYR